MTNVLTGIFVLMVIVLGFGAVWMITMNGSTSASVEDSFGNTPSPEQVQASDQAAGLAVQSNGIIPAAFFLSLLVVIAAAFMWFGKSGPNRSSKY